MTDCALAAATTTTARPKRVAHLRRPIPSGVPRWLRFLGVALIPLDDHLNDHRAGSRRTWVLSAGAGTSHIAALLLDDPTDD
jgi:hypothetical protein